MRRSIRLAVLVLLAACGSAESRIEGIYRVQSVDGAPLPAPWTEDMRLKDGAMMLADGEYNVTLELVSTDGSLKNELTPSRDGGTYRVRGQELEFETDQGGGGAVAQWLPIGVVLQQGRIENKSLVVKVRGHAVTLEPVQPKGIPGASRR